VSSFSQIHLAKPLVKVVLRKPSCLRGMRQIVLGRYALPVSDTAPQAAAGLLRPQGYGDAIRLHREPATGVAAEACRTLVGGVQRAATRRGPDVSGPAISLMLAMTGRAAGLSALSGDGLAVFADRVAG
jgi:hypothetical protein